MLTKRYLGSTKNLENLLQKLVDGVAPPKFTNEHLKSIGFNSSNDRALIPLLKDLGFLSPEGNPTPRYHAYRDRSRSKAVMAEALHDAYPDVFMIREVPGPSDRAAVEGLFKSKHNSSDKVAQLQAMTFFALAKHADLSTEAGVAPAVSGGEGGSTVTRGRDEEVAEVDPLAPVGRLNTELHYTIQVHLPATKDIEVFNAIFRSLRENLLT
ncbi:DUF5343 domain-containing protein [Clavibacter michiganensis]|uniref:DUF5343 domain-containing protein n=1 Tax=Clavibacter michiganensis TaxID=28447 RepID=UPI00117E6F3E|nr:DUF5343 domain-containing protein [Clavibacter michiganensis]